MVGIWRRVSERLGVAAGGSRGTRPPIGGRPKRVELDTFSDRFIRIEALGFFGQFATSPNNRYLIGWSDRAPGGRVGGHRYEGKGSWILLKDGELLHSGTLERPQDGKVANGGTALLSDWLFGDGLDGIVAAYSHDGEQILNQRLSANIIDSGLSPQGAYAICRTANSPGSPDSCKLILFDIVAGAEIARWDPEPVPISGYEFDESAGLVHVVAEDGDRATYDLNGRMVDRDAWVAMRLRRGDLNAIKAAVEDFDEGTNKNTLDLILAGIEKAGTDADNYHAARAFRAKGELHEKLGQQDLALLAFDQALKLDPQVGVLRRAEKLRKAMQPGKKLKSGATRPRRSRIAKQADRLEIGHEIVELEKGAGKDWRSDPERNWTSIEHATLERYADHGWVGAAAEGGLILTLIKAASFRHLPERHADTFIEALYAQNVAFEEDRFDVRGMLRCINQADLTQLRRNWKLIAKRAGSTPAYYPNVRWEHVEGLFGSLGSERLSKITETFATAPYDLRAGWPDLTLWRNDQVRFVEVKGPKDSMHAKQARLISSLLRPLGFDVALAEVAEPKNDSR